MSRTCLELSQQPVEDLVRWSNDSIQSIIDDDDVNMVWRDVLPECLNTILSHCRITHCGSEMSGIAFQEQCIRTLCQCRWTDKQLVQLTAMFRDMQLPKNDHKQVVNKICSHLIDVQPTTLPPLVLQLLKLCKTYHIEIVLAHLAHYFNIRIYAKLEPPPSDSESTTMEIEDFVQYSTSELNKCLSTCIYHLTQGATDPELIKKHLKLWSKSQLLRSPFLLDLALAISDKGRDFRTASLDVIRCAIEQNILDQQKSKESAWVKSISSPSVDVSSVLKVLITERLSKSQPDTTRHILSQLADRLAGDSIALRQYSDCLYVLCKLTPVSVERCPQLSTIIENCQPTNEYHSAAAVLDAVHPLLSFSTRIRDTIVVVCRKRLYSRDSLHRCLALSGFLSVLRHIKLPRVTTLSNSQDQYSDNMSNYSYLTQITVDVHATQQGTSVNSRVRNEAMCMEVVSILRRCLIQDASVKQLLYSCIYESSKEKLALYEPILELLYEHLSKYLSEHDQSIIQFEKCVQLNATTAVLLEPIGQLLFTIAQYLRNVEEDDLEEILSSQNPDTASAHLKSKLETALTRFTESEQLTAHSSDNGMGLSDLTPESRAKCLKLQQRLQCLEALIGHQILQWTAASTNSANTVNRLYKCYNELLEHTKGSPKLSKKGKVSMNDTKEMRKSQTSQKSQKGEE
ncbi:Fanconi anemia group I protein [Eumeta japonica]|uniref:Fanconi anemia group I protein n=1 Tax=Eumeta variegata TaxID=151549 RepID=A0A4C1WB47_EUMVA|nr:Fanconi anemia group I protein [Eumeta japonica]